MARRSGARTAWRVLVVVGLGAAEPAAGAADDPLLAAAEPTAAHALVPEGATCIPTALRPTSPDQEARFDLQLGVVDQQPTLCLIGLVVSKPADAPIGPIACWSVDARKQALSYRAPRPLPGRTVPAIVDHGCARGLCLPRTVSVADGTEVRVAINDREDRAILIDGLTMGLDTTAYVFDRANRGYRGQRAVSAGLVTLFSGHAVVVEEAPAGPDAYVELYDLDQPAQAGFDPSEPRGSGDTRSIYLGFIALAAPGVLLVATGGLTDVVRADLGSGATRSLRHRKGSRCLADALDDTEDLERCHAAIAREVEPYTDADVVALGKGFLARLGSGDLAVLDRRLAVKRRFSPYCAN